MIFSENRCTLFIAQAALWNSLNRRAFQIRNPFHDHDVVALPLDQGLLHELKQSLGLLQVVPVGPQFQHQILLALQPFPPPPDVGLGFQEQGSFMYELFGSPGGDICHGST